MRTKFHLVVNFLLELDAATGFSSPCLRIEILLAWIGFLATDLLLILVGHSAPPRSHDNYALNKEIIIESQLLHPWPPII